MNFFLLIHKAHFQNDEKNLKSPTFLWKERIIFENNIKNNKE